MRDNKPENFRSLLIQKQLDDGADQHQGAADKKQNDERRSIQLYVVLHGKKHDRRQQRQQCPRHDEDGDDGDPAARQRPPMQAGDRAVFGTAFASCTRSLCLVARFSRSLDRDDKDSIIFRDPSMRAGTPALTQDDRKAAATSSG